MAKDKRIKGYVNTDRVVYSPGDVEAGNFNRRVGVRGGAALEATVILRTLGEAVSFYRIIANRMTQKALSTKAGLSAQCVSNVERGLTDPSFLTVCLIADALGVTVNDLRCDSETLTQKQREMNTPLKTSTKSKQP